MILSPLCFLRLLESLLRQRRIEAWRQETAEEAWSAIKALRSGKLKSLPVETLIAKLEVY